MSFENFAALCAMQLKTFSIWLYHNIACRAAIKGGNASKKEELIALAEELEANPDVRYCPHGRPIYVMLKKRMLEKEFGRV